MLSAGGFNETMSNSLTRSSYYEGCTAYPMENCVRILNPLSADLGVMRQTMVFNMLEAVQLNVNHRNMNLKLFEFRLFLVKLFLVLLPVENVDENPRQQEVRTHIAACDVCQTLLGSHIGHFGNVFRNGVGKFSLGNPRDV